MKKRIFVLAFLIITASVLGLDSTELFDEISLKQSDAIIGPKVLNSESEEILVARVLDGDTIEIETGEKVRYIGVDSPETNHPTEGVECFGSESKLFNQNLVEGKRVRLEKDISDKDKYGRLLRYVYIDELFVNDELVKKGYAQVSTFPPDVKYQDKFLVSQRDAMELGNGLWKKCF